MMNIDELTVKEARELAGEFSEETIQKIQQAAGELRIVVFQRGWVLVGRVKETLEMLHMADASVIRRWGTTAGLGELAQRGPGAETILDPCGDTRAHPLTVVLSMKCNEDNWK